MPLTVKEKEHWKERIEKKIDKAIEKAYRDEGNGLRETAAQPHQTGRGNHGRHHTSPHKDRQPTTATTSSGHSGNNCAW